MPDLNAGFPPRHLRTPEAARLLSLSCRTLEKHRTYGTGPAYRKIGDRVVHALDDLKAWADRGTLCRQAAALIQVDDGPIVGASNHELPFRRTKPRSVGTITQRFRHAESGWGNIRCRPRYRFPFLQRNSLVKLNAGAA
jgi:hypothetical protein